MSGRASISPGCAYGSNRIEIAAGRRRNTDGLKQGVHLAPAGINRGGPAGFFQGYQMRLTPNQICSESGCVQMAEFGCDSPAEAPLLWPDKFPA